MARAAVSSIIAKDYSKSDILKRIMKGIFQLRPQLQKNVTWDVSLVINHWKAKFPAHKMSLMMLTMKTALLLVLTMGQRQQGLHLIDVRNLEIKYDKIIIRYGDPLKTTNPNFHQGEIPILAYKDKRICPVWYLKEYLRRTNSYRNHNSLFLITMKPFTPASKSTISNWVRKALVKAGVDMNIFTPHSTRAAATTKMNKTNVSITTILNTAGWKNDKTFAKYYNKKIVDKDVSIKNLL